MNVEPLEARIAPAAVVNPTNPKLATYTDVDGDRVTIKVSSGDLNTAGIGTFPVNGHDQLAILDLSGGGFDDADLTISVVKVPGGDGLAHVGFIASNGHDLGAVNVQGDLGFIRAGDTTTANDPGVRSLTVASIGRFGAATSAGTGNYVASEIVGALGALKVKGDVTNAYLHVTGGTDGTIGSIYIGGSLTGLNLGAAADRPGAIEASGDIGVVKIGRDMQGNGFASGFIQSDLGKIKKVTIGGSLIGGPGQFSGQIRSGSDLGPVKIGGNVQGGAGASSGVIASDTGFGVDSGKITSVTIGGSLFGSSGADSGVIRSTADLGPVKIGHDAKGGSGDRAGQILSRGKLASITIGGSLVGDSGQEASLAGSFYEQGQIHSAGDLGPVKIGHDVLGGSGLFSGSIRSASGTIASITIGGSLIGGTRGGGVGGAGEITGANGIGPVKIAHDLIGGTREFCGSVNVPFGRDIASVTIGGSLIGGSGLYTGYIFADNIGPVKIGRDLIGGSIAGTATNLGSSGGISASGGLASVFIGGSIISGIDDSTGGDLSESAAILAGRDLGSLTVKGSILGHPDLGKGGSPVLIAARGQAAATATSDVAIGKISIGGNVEYTRILGGYSIHAVPSAALNADAQIGAVTVRGDWLASSLVAGAMNAGDPNFGDGNDVKISGAGTKDTADATLISKIASITIGGTVAGTAAPGDHFGFVAQRIGSFKAGAFTATLHTAAPPDVIDLSIITGKDVTVREI